MAFTYDKKTLVAHISGQMYFDTFKGVQYGKIVLFGVDQKYRR